MRDFHAYQEAFAAHIRDPRGHPRPAGVPARRMRVYNELLFHNLEGFLRGCFPVCREMLGVRRWTRLARAFFRDHRCHTPYFRQIPEEFLRFLAANPALTAAYPGWLAELAHYEWVELALETSNRDAGLPAYDPGGDLLAGLPLLNPVIRLLRYRWPVQRLGPGFWPKVPPESPTYILACRRADMAIRFLEINAMTARLVALLQEGTPASGRGAVAALAEECGLSGPEALLGHAGELLADLRRQGVILGTRLRSGQQHAPDHEVDQRRHDGGGRHGDHPGGDDPEQV